MARKPRVDRALEQTEGLIEICPARNVGMSRLLRHPYPHPGFKGETCASFLHIRYSLSTREFGREPTEIQEILPGKRAAISRMTRRCSRWLAVDLIRISSGLSGLSFLISRRKEATDNETSPVSSCGIAFHREHTQFFLRILVNHRDYGVSSRIEQRKRRTSDGNRRPLDLSARRASAKRTKSRDDEVEETIVTVLAAEVAKSRYSRFIYFDFVACSIYWKAA